MLQNSGLRLTVGAVVGLAFGGILWAQRADRATITGVVMDPNGAYVAGASVRVRNEGTGVELDLRSNDAGAYSSPLLVLGVYSVTVEHPGFKSFVRSGIQLTGGSVYRQDAQLELGAVTETVEVSAAAELINTSQPEVSNTVDQNYYKNLPVVMGSDIRLAEALLLLQPGYFPMKPNGDAMFRGSQFSSRMNGGQTFGAENMFDGAAFGYASGHQQSHESSPSIESIQEMKVTNSMYSAQYGHTTGGTIEYTSKSGTNEYHGTLYEYFANDSLNARGFFPVARTVQRSNAFGFTFSGPFSIPKIYDGRNRTFFFANMDWLRLRSGVLPGFGNTTPVDAFKQGDFSALLTGQQVGTDALGRPIYNGQIFDPNTTRFVDGVSVRDPFEGNRIPVNHPLRSAVAARVVPLMVGPDRPGLVNNVAGNPAGDQTWVANFRTPLIRVDHHFNPRFRTSHTFFWPYRPAIRNCGEVQGCNVRNRDVNQTSQNDDYIGIGFHQRIVTHHATQQFDAIITNNLLYHAQVSYDRWYMGGVPLSAGVGWPEKLWGANRGGLIDQTAGFPSMTFTGNVPYTQLGIAWIGYGFEAINRWQFSNDVTWIKGRHNIKVGYEFRHHQFNYKGWANSTGGSFNFNRLGTGGFDARGNSLAQTGDPFASFLLGQVHTANFLIPHFVTFNGNWTSLFINDDFKVTNRLTLTLGLRFDYQFPWTERYDRMSSFAADMPNPAAGGRLGALAFAGEGQGRTGQRHFFDIPRDAIGPRFGFAYRIGDRNVVRGGYGIYYNSKPFGSGPQPIRGYQGNPQAPNLTNGLQPAFYMDDGFPLHLIERPPFINPAFANGTTIQAVPRDELVLPRYQNWSFTVQREVATNMLADISYVANRGTRLPQHPNFLGPAANMNHPDVLQYGTAVLQSNIDSDLARSAGITPPYPGFTGNVAQALRPYPQYQFLDFRALPIGWSSYHSMQAKLDKRFSNGVQFRIFYTWSKLINNGAENAQRGGTGIQNPGDTQHGERALSFDDVPHTFVLAYSWELPFARNKTGLAGKLLRGWTLNGIFRYESARPLNVTMVNDLGGLLFNNQKRPDRVADADGTVNFDKFDPNRDRYFNPAAWSDPGPLRFGNAPRADGTVRGLATATTEDVSIFKETRFGERVRHRIEAQFGNFTNRTVFCEPNTNWSAGAFGQVGTQCNQPRSIQLGMKLEF
ncbi:MAG: TonB-dependent receptor [Bryobacteraceae bacterium]|nr:TonB-dependent receptor [Bryobacteraceae bacterium]